MSAIEPKDAPNPAPPFNEWGWILTLFGTAVGAGILYLPVQAGTAGIWALGFLTVLLFPLIYYSHKNVVIMLLAYGGNENFAQVLAGHCGRFFKNGIVLVYFLTFYFLLFAYLIGLNANLSAFLVKLDISALERLKGPWLSLLVVTFFAALHLIGEKTILRVMSGVSSVLIVLLFGIAVYLIPFWDITPYFREFSLLHSIDDSLLILPILTLSFVFFPALSSMVLAYYSSSAAPHEPERQDDRLNRIVLKTTLLLLLFVLFFVFSCLLSLSPQAFAGAADRNLNCLALLSDREGINPAIAAFGPLLGLAALVTSFIGVFFAVRESALHLVHRGLAHRGRGDTTSKTPPDRHRGLDVIVQLALFGSLWFLTLVNPSIISLFGLVISPLVAIFIFIMPTVVLMRTHGLGVLRKPSVPLVFLTGILVLFSFQLGTMVKHHFGF